MSAVGDIDGTAGVNASNIVFNAPNEYQAVLTLGDNSYQSNYTSFTSGWGRLKTKMYASTGNHDYSYLSSYDTAVSGAAGGKTAGGKYYYSFNLGEWHLIALDSSASDFNTANGTQITWLKADLAANTKKCVLAYWHHPRWSSSSNHGNQTQATAAWAALYAGGADVVLGGHDHDYERFGPQDPQQNADTVKGITEYVVGTGGASFYGISSTLQPNSKFTQNTKNGILKLTLKPNGWDSVFVPNGGAATLDAASGTCH
ncbi:MAG: metallophosphoesterase [Myxococcaceae bacterium]|nr:metallophosphoesterase [Myxococcaceae bacterium]